MWWGGDPIVLGLWKDDLSFISFCRPCCLSGGSFRCVERSAVHCALSTVNTHVYEIKLRKPNKYKTLARHITEVVHRKFNGIERLYGLAANDPKSQAITKQSFNMMELVHGPKQRTGTAVVYRVGRWVVHRVGRWAPCAGSMPRFLLHWRRGQCMGAHLAPRPPACTACTAGAGRGSTASCPPRQGGSPTAAPAPHPPVRQASNLGERSIFAAPA